MSAGLKNKGEQLLESLTEDNGLAIVFADGRTAPIEGVNNNSMCRALYSSAEFAARCDEFCGKAFDWATEAEKTVSYRCHANLNCKAVPLKTKEKQLVAIVGRTFLKSSEYRAATEKALAGEWSIFPPTQFFENVLLTGSAQTLEKLAERLGRLSDEERRELFETVNIEIKKGETEQTEISARNAESPQTQTVENTDAAPRNNQTTAPTAEKRENFSGKNREAEENSAWRSFFGSLLQLEYVAARLSILEFLQKRYGLKSLIWLENKENRLETVSIADDSSGRRIEIGVSADDRLMLEAARNGMPLELRERKNQESNADPQTINLFPVIIGGEVRSALATGDSFENEKHKRRIARFCRTIASDLEILRLRADISQRSRLARAVRKFNDGLKKIDAEDFWLNLTQVIAELLRAERASLLVYDEKADILQAKALIGVVNDLSGETAIGEKIARKILRGGKPLIVSQIKETDFAAAPPEYAYKTDSFLICPITIGKRKIAVLNFTGRADGGGFGDFDLELLQAVAPQIAVTVDHALLKNKAGEFEQLSVTDALTGLSNRLYLDRRLTEEISRSKRYRFPLSLLMIDVDFFKSYNDTFGHTEGDKALKMVGAKLKETLRVIDVAARYGGEEFLILLPQTTLDEAAAIAERLRARVENTVFPNRKVTVSIGVANCSDDVKCLEDLVSFADKALYEAKRKGRNSVRIYGNLENTRGE